MVSAFLVFTDAAVEIIDDVLYFFIEVLLFEFIAPDVFVGVGDEDIGRLKDVVDVQSVDMIEGIIVVLDQINDVHQSVADPPSNAAETAPCRIAGEVDDLFRLSDGHLVFFDFVLVFDLLFVSLAQ